jgi:hypothetical protein
MKSDIDNHWENAWLLNSDVILSVLSVCDNASVSLRSLSSSSSFNLFPNIFEQDALMKLSARVCVGSMLKKCRFGEETQ